MLEVKNINVTKINEPKTINYEIDHRLVKAPYVRIYTASKGVKGDTTYVYDLRVTQPNINYLSTKQLHSMEHMLLFGFRKHMPNNFINVGPMGCQTGFYLIILNEGSLEKICNIYAKILLEIIEASEVAYVNAKDCGQYQHHDLQATKEVAKTLLACKQSWTQVI